MHSLDQTVRVELDGITSQPGDGCVEVEIEILVVVGSAVVQKMVPVNDVVQVEPTIVLEIGMSNDDS